MPLLRTAAERAACPTICYFHQVPFVRFGAPSGNANYSMGCPICVKEWNDHVKRQLDYSRHREQPYRPRNRQKLKAV